MPKCLQILRHKKRSPMLSRQCCQVWRFSPQIRGIHVSDGEFQFGFGEICLEFKFLKKQIYIYIWGIFEGVFLILEQPTWQHCSPGSAGVVTMLFSDWSKKEANFFLLFGATCQGLLSDAQKGEKPSMFLASDVIKRHFGVHTESQESSSLPVAKHFLGLCLVRRRL